MADFDVARWSRYLIYAILATLPLERIPSFELTEPITATLRISQALGVALILINLPAMWRQRGQWARPPWLWLGVFWLVCLLSAGLAADLQRAMMVVAYTVFVGVLAWVVALRFEAGRMAVYAKVLLGAALVACVFGLYQFFGDMLGLPPEWTGLAAPYTSAVFGFPRVQSTGLEPLYFDNFLLIPIGLALGYLVHQAARTMWRWWAALAFMAMIVFVNVSRGAMVAMLLVAIIAMGVAVARKQARTAGLIAAAMVVAAVTATGLIALGSEIAKNKTAKSEQAVKNFTKQATNVSQGQSAVFRTLSREEAVKLWQAAPALGVGPGNFGRRAHEANPRVFKNELAIVNNEALEILAETGALGLGAILLFGLALARLFVAHLRAAVRPEVRAWGLGLALALVAIAAQYMTFSTLYITHIWVAIGLFVGVMMLTAKPGRRRRAA